MKPKIRFKDFGKDWEESIVLDKCKITTGKSNTQDQVKNGLYPFYIRSERVVRSNKYLYDCEAVITIGDGNIGRVFHYVNEKFDLHQRCYMMKDFKDVDALYFYYFFSTFFYDRAIRMSAKATVDSVRLDMIAEMPLHYPINKKEQKDLTKYFCSLDSLISSFTCRLASLKQIKAASLQSMFPQEGETTPRIRFKGFEGEWDPHSLKEFARKIVEKNTARIYNETFTNSAEFGVISQRDFFDHDISNDDNISRYYVIHSDNFVYNPRISVTAPVGPINRNLLNRVGIMSPLYFIFRVDGVDKDYLDYFFKTTLWHKYMLIHGNAGARFDRLSIADDKFLDMPIIVPKDIAEQQKIADYFKNLDRQITLQTRRLEKLKQIKAACLDKMFV